jgi:hypothetical protein
MSKQKRRDGLITRAIALAVVPAILAGFGGCRTLQLASDWATKPVKVDGESSDWILTSGNAIGDENVQVNASNDSASLHLMVRFRANNETWARPCAMTGLTVWLCPNGKKSENLGVRFVAGPAAANLPKPSGWSRGPDEMRSNREQRQREFEGQLVFMDKKADTTAVLATEDSLGPGAGFTCESGMCTYELSLPLGGDGAKFGIGARAGGVAMLGLTAGLSKEEREALRAERPGAPEGGLGGGPPSGGMRGGPPGGGMGGGPPGGGRRPAMAENPELWFKVKLAPAGAAGTEEEMK